MREGRQVARLVLAAAAAAGIVAGVHAAQSEPAVDRFVGRPAPRLDPGLSLGPKLPGFGGAPVLLFFWAHWCPQCKAQSPIVAQIFDRYRSRGLTLVAPTRRYGYLDAGRPAAPDKELRHIVEVRDTYYKFLQHLPVPVAESNYDSFGVDAVPTEVVIDRSGIVRTYHVGRMTEQELQAAVLDAIER